MEEKEDKNNIKTVLEALEKERGIKSEDVFKAVKEAIAVEYFKRSGEESSRSADDIEVDTDDDGIHIYEKKKVVDTVVDVHRDVPLEQAREIDPDFEVGDDYLVEVTPKDFGRIAATNAKQVIQQKLKDAEREFLLDKFSGKIDEIVSGKILYIENRYHKKENKYEPIVHVDLGGIEGIISPKDQVEGETYTPRTEIKAYAIDIRSGKDIPDSKGGKRKYNDPVVILSRRTSRFVERLLELEVPEIQDGTVEIVSIARDAGSRTKVAVRSNLPEVDPVGACIGSMSNRIKNVTGELNGEKIDVIKWSEYPEDFIINALSPAKVIDIAFGQDEKGANVANITVPNDQTSLAIGAKGQNVRLAALLTGWKINIDKIMKSGEEASRELYGDDSEN